VICFAGKINSSGTCSFTLVTRGELEHPQTPNVWICAFCKKGPHVNGAGDLFGPYLIRSNEDLDQDVSEKKKVSLGFHAINAKLLLVETCPIGYCMTGLSDTTCLSLIGNGSK